MARLYALAPAPALVVVVVAAAVAFAGCRVDDAAPGSQVKTLDSLASNGAVGAASCHGSIGPAEAEAKLTAKLPDAAKTAVKEALSALPIDLKQTLISEADITFVPDAQIGAQCAKATGAPVDPSGPSEACVLDGSILISDAPAKIRSHLVNALGAIAYQRLGDMNLLTGTKDGKAFDRRLDLTRAFLRDVQRSSEFELADLAPLLRAAMPLGEDGKPLPDEQIDLARLFSVVNMKDHENFASLVFMNAFDSWFCTGEGGTRDVMMASGAFPASGGVFSKAMVPALKTLGEQGKGHSQLALLGGGLFSFFGRTAVGAGRLVTGKWDRLGTLGGTGGWIGGYGPVDPSFYGGQNQIAYGNQGGYQLGNGQVVPGQNYGGVQGQPGYGQGGVQQGRVAPGQLANYGAGQQPGYGAGQQPGYGGVGGAYGGQVQQPGFGGQQQFLNQTQLAQYGGAGGVFSQDQYDYDNYTI